MITRRAFAGLMPAAVAAAGLATPFAVAHGQEVFPNRPVRLVVPYPPGGTTDIVGRLVAGRLSEIWRQPVVVENRAGASGSIGADVVAKSQPNGYTLVLGNSASHGANGLLNPSIPYDSERDFAPITLLAIVKQALVVHPSVAAQNAREFVALVKSRPGQFNYGSSAVGGAPHLAAELFRLVAGVDIVHIPYSGAAPSMNALVAGNIQFMFASVPTVVELARSGRIRTLAVASATRSGLLPDAPTMGEAGFAGVEMDSWFGLLAPAGTPPAIIAKINADTVRAVDGDDMRKRMADLGFERATGTPEALGALISRELVRLRRLIAEARITGN
ncbi:MAG: tripartite tricarboxylate transporter substrate binding protein [Alphaproteobacteria bacterium]|nr:tripartite tricarboxylate transporter substrate binding protein [Alphaproteobacteria bacterium]